MTRSSTPTTGPKIFFNALSSHFFAPAFSAYAYERTGSLILFNPVLNDSIFAPEPDWVMQASRYRRLRCPFHGQQDRCLSGPRRSDGSRSEDQGLG